MLGDLITLMIELADARSQEVIWANEIQGDLAESARTEERHDRNRSVQAS